MDIHNSIDGKGLKATNFADGTANTDLATVGQLGGGSTSPVIFEGGYNGDYTVWNQSSINTSLNTNLTKTSLFTSRYTNNCSYISDGTNNVVQITETGFFKATLFGTVFFKIHHSSPGLSFYFIQAFLEDSSSKSVINTGVSIDAQLDVNIGTSQTGTDSQRNNLYIERIYSNPSGTLNIGAWLFCMIDSTNATTRGLHLYYPRLIVTKL